MVSIMPGMLSRAPERTDTSSGSRLLPNFLPTARSSLATCAFTSLSSCAGSFLPLA